MKKFTRELLPVKTTNTPPELFDSTAVTPPSQGEQQERFQQRMQKLMNFKQTLNRYIQQVRSLGNMPPRDNYLKLREGLDKLAATVKMEREQLNAEDYRTEYPKVYDEWVNLQQQAVILLDYLVKLSPREV